MASKQQQGFRMCVHPCPHYLMGGDTHILCVVCLGEEHCDVLPLRMLRSRLAFFPEDAQARVPQRSGPAADLAQRRLRSWDSQRDLSAEVETSAAFSLPFLCLHLTDSVPRLRVGKHALWFLPP